MRKLFQPKKWKAREVSLGRQESVFTGLFSNSVKIVFIRLPTLYFTLIVNIENMAPVLWTLLFPKGGIFENKM